MNEKVVHVCPMLMRTVIWEDGKCTEDVKAARMIIENRDR